MPGRGCRREHGQPHRVHTRVAQAQAATEPSGQPCGGEEMPSPPASLTVAGAARTPAHEVLLGGAWNLVRERDIHGAVRWLAVHSHLRPFCGCGCARPCPTVPENVDIVRSAWLAVAGDAISVLDRSQHTDENSEGNLTSSSSSDFEAGGSEASLRASSVELLARLIHLIEEESCQDPLFVGFEDELCTLFLLPKQKGEAGQRPEVRPNVRMALVHALMRPDLNGTSGNDHRGGSSAMRLLCLSLLLKLVSLEPHYQGEMHISKKTVAKGLSAAAKIVALAETGGGTGMEATNMFVRALVREPWSRSLLLAGLSQEANDMLGALLLMLAASRKRSGVDAGDEAGDGRVTTHSAAAGMQLQPVAVREALAALTSLVNYGVARPCADMRSWECAVVAAVSHAGSDDEALQRSATSFLASLATCGPRGARQGWEAPAVGGKQV